MNSASMTHCGSALAATPTYSSVLTAQCLVTAGSAIALHSLHQPVTALQSPPRSEPALQLSAVQPTSRLVVRSPAVFLAPCWLHPPALPGCLESPWSCDLPAGCATNTLGIKGMPPDDDGPKTVAQQRIRCSSHRSQVESPTACCRTPWRPPSVSPVID